MSKPEVTIWSADHQAESRFDTGALQHTLLMGVDYRHAVTDSRSARGVATPLDLYDPVYGTFDPSGITLSDVPQQRAVQKGLASGHFIKTPTPTSASFSGEGSRNPIRFAPARARPNRSLASRGRQEVIGTGLPRLEVQPKPFFRNVGRVWTL